MVFEIEELFLTRSASNFEVDTGEINILRAKYVKKSEKNSNVS